MDLFLFKKIRCNIVCNLCSAGISFKFSSRYARYFKEFRKLEQEDSRNTLLKSSVCCDTNLPSYGNIHFKQKNYKENCQEKIPSDTVFNQFFQYKTPSLADHHQPLKKVLEYGKSLSANNVSLNKMHSDIQNTTKSISPVLSTLEAGKNGVKMEPTVR